MMDEARNQFSNADINRTPELEDEAARLFELGAGGSVLDYLLGIGLSMEQIDSRIVEDSILPLASPAFKVVQEQLGKLDLGALMAVSSLTYRARPDLDTVDTQLN